LYFIMCPCRLLLAEAYEPEYGHNLMYLEEYRPSDLLQADNGERGLDGCWLAWLACDPARLLHCCAVLVQQ
jgi:hypothetical protein